MNRRRLRSVFIPTLISLGVCSLIFLAPAVRADSISFQLSTTSQSTTSRGTVTFDGSVINNSGADLNASDFFFNFSAFVPGSVSPIQLLGVLSDFSIPNGATTPVVELFEVTLGPVPPNSIFSIAAQLENSAGDLSAIQTVNVSVPGSVSVPEPGVLLLLAMGLLALALARVFFALR